MRRASTLKAAKSPRHHGFARCIDGRVKAKKIKAPVVKHTAMTINTAGSPQ
jgi:hypothetical protein